MDSYNHKESQRTERPLSFVIWTLSSNLSSNFSYAGFSCWGSSNYFIITEKLCERLAEKSWHFTDPSQVASYICHKDPFRFGLFFAKAGYQKLHSEFCEMPKFPTGTGICADLGREHRILHNTHNVECIRKWVNQSSLFPASVICKGLCSDFYAHKLREGQTIGWTRYAIAVRGHITGIHSLII